MFGKLSSCLTTLVLASQCSAHFYLNYPPSIGFDDSLEGTPPCGSFTPNPSKDNVTNYYVGGTSLAMTSIHPQATWLFRATLDITTSANWTILLPAVIQTGLGDYCEQSVAVPASFVGKQGIIGVVQDAPDGILYQCAVVNFVAGTQPTVPSICTNVTGLSASFTADPNLSSLPASATSSVFSTVTSASSTTSTTSTTTAKPSSGNTVLYSGMGALGWALLVGSATFMACFFL